MSVVHFLSYHNAVPVTLSLLLLGAGAAFAASPEARESIYAEEVRTIAIDNTYIVNKDLSSYSPQVNITAVTEDNDAYYVSYTLSTINIVDGVWKDVVEGKSMKVDKTVLGVTTDLGLYVTEQLRQVVGAQQEYLREVQSLERKQVSQKVVATEYSGLVGQFVNVHTEVLPGYVPVVTPPPVVTTDNAGVVGTTEGNTPSPGSGVVAPVSSGDGAAPVLTIMGNNPARIPLRSSYVDLGVIVTDNVQSNITVHYFVNDVEKPYVNIDTTVATTTVIRYEATDPSGLTGYATRVVEVYDPAPQPPPVPVEELTLEATSTTEIANGDSTTTATSSTE